MVKKKLAKLAKRVKRERKIVVTRRRRAEESSMTTEQYLAALRKLDASIDPDVSERITTASARTAQALGMSVRQCQRIGFGQVPVPEPVARLLRLYLEHGVPSYERP
jgi:hypothetical protein